MGSGRKRKESDNTLIRRPKSAIYLSAAGTGGSAAPPDNASDVCIPSFDVRVKESYFTKAKVKVDLRKKEEAFLVMIGENEVGKLNQKHSTMISTCMKLGLRYAGEIIIKNEKPYARFNRISR